MEANKTIEKRTLEEQFISKWSSWWCLEHQHLDYNDSFKRELHELFQQKLLSLGKEILKHKNEQFCPAVPVSDIIKCFDKSGVKIEDEINF
jgi:hypothetical protein